MFGKSNLDLSEIGYAGGENPILRAAAVVIVERIVSCPVVSLFRCFGEMVFALWLRVAKGFSLVYAANARVSRTQSGDRESRRQLQ
jgi:hypothetical protein